VWVDVIGGGGVDRQAARHPLPSGPHTGGAVRACGAGGRGLAGVWRVRRAVAGLGQPGAAASRRMPGRDCAARRPQPRPDRRREGLSTCVHECLADECLPGRAMSSIDTERTVSDPDRFSFFLPRCFPVPRSARNLRGTRVVVLLLCGSGSGVAGLGDWDRNGRRDIEVRLLPVDRHAGSVGHSGRWGRQPRVPR
jgi:hypothetical protein